MLIQYFLIGLSVGLSVVILSRYEPDEIQSETTNIIQNNDVILEIVGFAFVFILLVFIVPSFSRFLARNNRFKEDEAAIAAEKSRHYL